MSTACRQCDARYDAPAPPFCGRCGATLLERAVGDAEPAVAREADHSGGLAVPADRDPLIGRVIAGRYRVLERLGAGGMGAVYRVEHTVIGKIAALKMLHPAHAADKELILRFRTEARAISLLTHPNTVQVFDFGEADGALFMVMELVPGEELGKLLEREGPLPWKRLGPLLIQICDALAEAHVVGIVHRDLKPENVLVRLGHDGREAVKVLDFGLAKLGEQNGVPTVTSKGDMLIGTPHYMAPEQIRAEPFGPRADVYALGAVAYHLLTAAHAYDGDTSIKVLTEHLNGQLVPPSVKRPDLGIDQRAEEIVLRCLRRDPAERFADAAALGRAIRASLGAGSGEWDSIKGEFTRSSVEKLSRRDLDRFEGTLRRRRWMGLGTVLLVLGAALGAGYALALWDRGLPVGAEVEPNDTATQANTIALGSSVHGHLGRRMAREQSDRDFFRFHVAAGVPSVSATLKATPNMQLHLAIFDRRGGRVADAQATRDGEDVALAPVPLTPGDYYVEVREVWVSGRMATENVSDEYTLRVTPAPAARP